MIRLRISELLKENGKTKYWLFMQLGGTSYQSLSNMINNRTRSISIERIEILCRLFNCTPNDLFEITDD